MNGWSQVITAVEF